MHTFFISRSRVTQWAKPAIIFMALLLTTIATYSLWNRDRLIPAESGLLESGQLVLLVLACVLSCHHAKIRLAMFPAEAYLRIGLALFCFALILRECDIDQLGSSPWWKILELSLRCATLVAFIVYAGVVASKRTILSLNFHTLRQIPMIILALLGCVTYLASWPFDKALFDLPEALSTFIEESLELNACALLFCASFTK